MHRPRPTAAHLLRRLRIGLVLIAALTATLIAAACRLQGIGRGVAALGVLCCLVAWLACLEAEGHLAKRLERRPGHRPAGRRPSTPRSHTRGTGPGSGRRPRRRRAA